jgi:tetratricopeptide (TPR) repeat protein
MPKLSLYLRMVAAVGDIKTLVQMATDELFHELGVQPEIMNFLDKAATSAATEPEDRFWALDGLVFADVKHGNYEKASERQEAMARLIADHGLGVDERLALSMKRMNLLAEKGDADGVLASISEISELLPETRKHQRIFRYNAAHALFSLQRYEAAIAETSELIQEYYDVLGIGPEDVLGRNPDKIRPHLKTTPDLPDHLKHLADCLDLHAHAMNAAGHVAPFARIHAMKFYEMANAADSLIRVGQDLVDEFVGRNDFVGAREIIETNLLPNVLRLKMLSRIIPVRSQYAVVLAFCGAFDAAEAEMERLAPYEAGLDEKGQWKLRNQRKAIAELRQNGPPPQWMPSRSRTATIPGQKIGRNVPCPCGSGKKYKKCHGLNT